MRKTIDILRAAKAAAPTLALLSEAERNEGLRRMAAALLSHADEILTANAAEVEAARTSLGEVMIDRLTLTEERIRGMAEGILQVADLPDPLGITLDEFDRPNGLHLQKVSVPLGVVGMIYESRPNVTADAIALCFKSGNACVLKAGKEAHATALAIARVMREAVANLSVGDGIAVLEDNSRDAARELMEAVGYLDVLIPRGGAGLIRACVEQAKIPCIETGTGICHIYVDRDAELDRALAIVENAKTSRPSVCNAAEVCLVHREVAATFLPRLAKRLVADREAAGQIPVELRLCPRAAAVIDGKDATETDFDTEFLAYILAVRVVDDVAEAISHIAAHSTHHSDAIVTENAETAERFIRTVDSAAVYVNASTRFTDGGEFGLGCEIGISTQKLHARGPMGLSALTSYKYIVRGNGQVR
ncbi:MAG: glutamate-5-semialdehyde dehydrogenase [Clostridia bacterium]|nr:glutamate-5-semialdehyde dehydrogenase [Clostridia bacterium]